MITDSDKINSMWRRYKETKGQEIRNELVLHYIYLVKRIVNRIYPKYKNHSEYDDLISCGVLGLMDAIDKFDLSKEVKFETYASLRIRGEIIDHMRKQDPIPVNIRAKLRKIENAYEELEHELGRTPTEDEVAESAGMSVKEMNKTLEETHCFNVMSLDEVIAETINISDSIKSDEDIALGFDKKELKNILIDSIKSLPEKERLVINLYYYDELTLKEIALVLGLTESRISQIHSKVLIKLRSCIKSYI